MEDTIKDGFIWVNWCEKAYNSFGELKPISDEIIQELIDVEEAVDIEEMFTDKSMETLWVNVEGEDFGFIYMEYETEEEVRKELAKELHTIIEEVKKEEGIKVMEGKYGDNKMIILTGIKDEEEVEFVHYKIVYKQP